MSDLCNQLYKAKFNDHDTCVRLCEEAADRIEELEAAFFVGSEECQRFSDQVDYLGAENERLEAEVERLQSALTAAEMVGLRCKNVRLLKAEIERLREQVKYWARRHDILRDRYEPNWGNGR